MRLETDRLELVAATPALLRAELESVASLAAFLAVAVPDAWPPPLNTPETVAYTQRFLDADPANAGWMSWYLIQLEGRELIGQVGYCGRPQAGVVEVGYSLVEAFHHHGYATEAVRALIEHARGCDVHTVSAHTLPELLPSIRVLERLGFQCAGAGAEEGTIRYALKVQ